MGIKMVRSSEANNHIVRNIQSTFNVIGKMLCTKYLCAAHHVLSELVVSKSTRQCHLLSHTSHIPKLNRIFLQKYSIIRENIDTSSGKYCWDFVGRLTHRDINIIDVLNELV